MFLKDYGAIIKEIIILRRGIGYGFLFIEKNMIIVLRLCEEKSF